LDTVNGLIVTESPVCIHSFSGRIIGASYFVVFLEFDLSRFCSQD
jgi:hypothetical protein